MFDKKPVAASKAFAFKSGSLAHPLHPLFAFPKQIDKIQGDGRRN